MTEAEWLACDDPTPMLRFLQGTVSERKLRLFTVACCRTIWHLLPDQASQNAVTIAEQFADGMSSTEELESVLTMISQKREAAWRQWRSSQDEAAAHAVDAAEDCLLTPPTAEDSSLDVAVAQLAASDMRRLSGDESWIRMRQHYWKAHSQLLNDIIGNPFSPVTFAPAWRTATVASLAEAAYTERAFDRLPILADALEDAGCDNRDILDHCRGPGPHVRGCWVVDLVLGKE